MKSLTELRKYYEEYINKSDGTDPDFPMMSFGNKGGESYTSKNNIIHNRKTTEEID